MRLLILTAALLLSVIGSFAYHIQATTVLRSELKAEAFRAMADVPLTCDLNSRLDAAAVSYKVGCLLATIRICSSQGEPEKFGCYKRGQQECEYYTPRYRAWLATGAKE